MVIALIDPRIPRNNELDAGLAKVAPGIISSLAEFVRTDD